MCINITSVAFAFKAAEKISLRSTTVPVIPAEETSYSPKDFITIV